MSSTAHIAIIGGSGFEDFEGADVLASNSYTTPFGEPSAPVMTLRIADVNVSFLSRHGPAHNIAPHLINYRANIWSLQEAGATSIIGVNAVGVISAAAPLGTLVLPEQVVDYSWGRESSFFDGVSGDLQHIDFTRPYDDALRRQLAGACEIAGVEYQSGGNYAVTQGPRLETAAEVDRLDRDGANIIGMTGMPEAVLARELNIDYACLALLVNYAAGRGSGDIHADLSVNMLTAVTNARRVLTTWLGSKASTL